MSTSATGSTYSRQELLYTGDPWETSEGQDDSDGTKVLFLQLNQPYSDVPAVRDCFLHAQHERSRQVRAHAPRRAEGLVIPLILAAGRADDGRPYQVVERYPGMPLDLSLGLPTAQLQALLLMQVETLLHIAPLGVVHGYLEPGSALVCVQGKRVLSGALLDLGKAQIWAEYAKATCTAPTNRWLHSPYRAPEQRDSKEMVLTPAADIYSLGAIYSELLMGQSFGMAHVTGSHPLPAGIPVALLQLVRAMLSEKPDARPSYVQIRDELLSMAPGAAVASAASSADRVVAGAVVAHEAVPASLASATTQALPTTAAPAIEPTGASVVAGDARPYPPGETLAQRLRRVQQLDEQNAVMLGIKLLEFLRSQSCEEGQLTELCPASVYLERGEQGDESLSLLRGPKGADGQEIGAWQAEPAQSYQPPEALRVADSDVRVSAVHAAGAIVYHALTGRPPRQYTPVLVQAMRAGELTAEPRPILQLRPKGLVELAELVDSWVATDPARRPESTALLAELRWLQCVLKVRERHELIDGQYQISELLSIGGTAATFRAKHPRTGGQLVIKVARPNFAVCRFVQEARISATVKHPDLVQAFGAGKLEDGTPYIALEYIAGDNLANYLQRRGGPLPEALVIHLALSYCDALAALHAGGIVHRDVAAENMMVQEDAHVPFGVRCKVIDLGIAKAAPSGPASRPRTQVGSRLGRPHYWPPEQAQDPSQVTDRADVYAAGALMVELLGGALPISLPLPRRLASRHLRLLIASMVAAQPGLRPSMAKVVEALRGMAQPRPTLVRSPLPTLAALSVGSALLTIALYLGLQTPRSTPLPIPPSPERVIRLESTPAGAEIRDLVSGAQLGMTPRHFSCSAQLRPPGLRVELRKLGYEPAQLVLQPCRDDAGDTTAVRLQPVVWRLSGRPRSVRISDAQGNVLQWSDSSFQPGERYAAPVSLTLAAPCYRSQSRLLDPWKSETIEFELQKGRETCPRRRRGGRAVIAEVAPTVRPEPGLVDDSASVVKSILRAAEREIDSQGPSSINAIRDVIQASEIMLKKKVLSEACTIASVWHRYSTKKCAGMQAVAIAYIKNNGKEILKFCPDGELAQRDLQQYAECQQPLHAQQLH